MSRTKKDGKRGGGHRNTQGREIWSRRCHIVNMWDVHTPDAKRITHRFERRLARADVASRSTDGRGGLSR